MNQEEKIRPEYEDEINLMDYVKIIIKRKWLIFSVFLLAVIAAGVFSFLMPKVYKIDTVLEIGQVAGNIVEVPSQIIGKIEGDVYGNLVRKKLNISEAEYPKIKAENPKDTLLIKMGIKPAEPQLAVNILEEINSLILENHQNRIAAKKELFNNDIKRIKIKISSLGEEKKILESKVGALEEVVVYRQDPGGQFALFVAKEKLEVKKQEIENLYLKINSLKRELQDIRFTKIIKAPTVSEEPIKPRPLLNMAIAGILGLFIGVFLAFGKEWWKKNNQNN